MNKVLLQRALDKLMVHVETNHLIKEGQQPEFEALIAQLISTAIAQPVQLTPPPPSAIWHMRDWITRLKRCSDDGKHMYIPCGLSSGMCWELAKELEQFVETVAPPKESV